MSGSSSVSRAPRAGGMIPDLWRAALASLVKQWIAQIRWNFQIRRGVNALMALDDRMLADIGLTRGAVEYAVRHGHVPTPAAGGS